MHLNIESLSIRINAFTRDDILMQEMGKDDQEALEKAEDKYTSAM